MKKLCVFYGNCQVIYDMHRILNKIPEFREQYDSIQYVNHDRDQIIKLSNINIDDIKRCDVFIYQPLNENHGVFATGYIKKFLKSNCLDISFPYVYNSAFYTVYWESASPRWTIGTLINCGWQNIMAFISHKYSLSEIIKLYDDGKLDFYFNARMNVCIESLREKEKYCDIKVSNFILNNFKNIRLFRTQNHLTDYFFEWMAIDVLEILGINNSRTLLQSTTIDNVIDQYCTYDAYNKSHYNFSYETLKIEDDNCIKLKISSFYDFFSNNNNLYKSSDFKLFDIKDSDPEKFLD